MKFSTVIAARDEERDLPAALESVRFCDDIVVVIDTRTTDNTAKVAEAGGARVFEREFDGFATQKNYAIGKAKHDWVLVLDGDERVDHELSRAIRELPDHPKAAAYEFSFRHYLGRAWLGHGGLYPDLHARLLDRRRARYEGREVHEQLKIDGDTERLPGNIEHLTYRDSRQYLEKVRKYSLSQAREDVRLKKIKKFRRPLKAAIGEFVLRYHKLQGWKDGWAGVVSAVLLSYYQYLYWREAAK